MPIGAFTLFCVEKAGMLTLSVSGGFIARWAYNYAINRQNGALRLSLERGEQRLQVLTRSGSWIVFMINSLTGGKSAA